ncbi:MAG: amino acid adenylation domain-containing protein, partial [Planctomycetia bacterium]
MTVTITSFKNCQSGTDAAFFMLTPHRQAETPTRESIAAEGCIHRRFERWVAATPDAPAVTCEGRTVSYGELDRLAVRVARRLRSVGAGPDAIVGLLADRSIDLIVGLLGILKADAAYFPLDPGHPPDRRAWMLADAKVRVVVTQERFEEELRQTGMATVLVDGSAVPTPTLDEALATFSPDAGKPSPRAGHARPDHLAYVIYTSGSTGRPNGVMITHHNVVRLMASTEPLFGFGASDVTTLFHSIAFDFSVWELWGALAYGGRLVVVPVTTARDPLAFRELLVTEKVTVLNQTPSVFRQLIEADQSAEAGPSTLALRWVIFGGEALPMRMLAPWFERHGDERPRLVNMYGITETTVHVTWRVLSAADVGRMSLIGGPLSDLEILLLGNDLLPVADGETGEIHVGGPGLARGYLGRPELTAERFIPHPFRSVPGARLYRSGDLARRLSDGELEYRGRADHQVKVRGHRVEPGEIETTLLTHPAVRAAAVLPFRDGDETSLAAFLVRRNGSDESIDGLRSWLESRLPSAFVPARLVPVGSLPLNANGKLDRSLLLARLDDHDKPTRGEPARPGTELRVALLWRSLLRGPAPGRNDDFFALGGHSLMAMRLVAAIQREFHVRLPVTTVFETRTLSRLAAAIDGAVAEGAERTAAGGASAETPVSEAQSLPAQRGMWLLDALLPDRATYNQPFAYRPEGPVDWERFRASLRRTMACHPALRSLFEGGDEGPVQRVVPIDSVPVPWSVEPAVDEAAIGAALLAHARVPFDLTTAPLWRATLFPAAAPHGVLLLNFHHAIIDLWSIDLLLQELAGPEAEESDGERPPVEASRFRLPGLVPAERDRCVGFWRETLADATGELAWPGRWSSWDGGRTGGSHRFGIDAEASAALHRMAVETGATTFQILLAVFHGWLHRVTGTDDVVVGTPVSLRSTPEVQASVNCFLNTLPVRIRWGDEGIAGRAFTDLVGHVRETFLAAVSHGDLPFDEIVAAATEGRAGERSPIVTTVFVHTEKGPTAAWLGGVRCEPIPVDTGTAKFDLTLFLEGNGADLKGAFEYDRRRFDEPTIAGYAASFSTFFRSLLSAPAEPLERAALLSADERQRVVHDWNDTATDLGPPASLQGLFAAQVLRSPGTVALDCGGESLSYLQLAERVNRLARFLRSRGVGPDVPVAVCLERSVEMVVALLG